MNVVAGTRPLGFSVSRNVVRRHLTAGQRAALAYELMPLYEAEAAKRRHHGIGRPAKDEKVGADLPQPSESKQDEGVADAPEPTPRPSPKKPAPRARDRAAKKANTSPRATAQFKRVAEQAPDLASKTSPRALRIRVS